QPSKSRGPVRSCQTKHPNLQAFQSSAQAICTINYQQVWPGNRMRKTPDSAPQGVDSGLIPTPPPVVKVRVFHIYDPPVRHSTTGTSHTVPLYTRRLILRLITSLRPLIHIRSKTSTLAESSMTLRTSSPR
ncbi:MAG: hypothetical protein LQ341_006031, partial [Variospora aurantia]